jgi:hypothetical protein
MKDLKILINNFLDNGIVDSIPGMDAKLLITIRAATNIAIFENHILELNLILNFLKQSADNKITPNDVHDACLRIGRKTPIIPPPNIDVGNIATVKKLLQAPIKYPAVDNVVKSTKPSAFCKLPSLPKT